MATRAVLFDLDNTLYDRDEALESFVRRQYHELDLAAYKFSEETWTRRFIELDHGGMVWKDSVYSDLRDEFGLRNTTAELLTAYEQGFAQHSQPRQGVDETLQNLRENGWKIGVVTNGRTEFQRRTLDALGLEVDSFVDSEAYGWRKPDPRIFRQALGDLNATPEQSWFVGDHPEADIKGARSAGLRAIWFRTQHQSKPEDHDGEIGHFSELPALLEL